MRNALLEKIPDGLFCNNPDGTPYEPEELPVPKVARFIRRDADDINTVFADENFAVLRVDNENADRVYITDYKNGESQS